MSEKELAEKTLTAEMVQVTVRLYQPFYDFMKDYMAFFGIKDSVEDFCRTMIYKQLLHLHNELSDFVSDRTHLIDGQAWYLKHFHVASAAFGEGEENEEESEC